MQTNVFRKFYLENQSFVLIYSLIILCFVVGILSIFYEPGKVIQYNYHPDIKYHPQFYSENRRPKCLETYDIGPITSSHIFIDKNLSSNKTIIDTTKSKIVLPYIFFHNRDSFGNVEANQEHIILNYWDNGVKTFTHKNSKVHYPISLK